MPQPPGQSVLVRRARVAGHAVNTPQRTPALVRLAGEQVQTSRVYGDALVFKAEKAKPRRCKALDSGTCIAYSFLPAIFSIRGEVAQLGEHRLRKAGVEGSNPFFSTTISRGYG